MDKRSLHDLIDKAIYSFMPRSFAYIERHSIGNSDFFAVFVVEKNMKASTTYRVKAIESSINLDHQLIYNSFLSSKEYSERERRGISEIPEFLVRRTDCLHTSISKNRAQNGSIFTDQLKFVASDDGCKI